MVDCLTYNSARLFKHYHEQKEKAEEALNEVDPPPHSFLRDTPQVIPSKVRGTPPEAPHDVHINIISQHSDGHQGQGHQQQHFMGFEPKVMCTYKIMKEHLVANIECIFALNLLCYFVLGFFFFVF